MSPSTTISPPARTWRDIPQNVAPRAMSSAGRKRLAFATLKSVLALAFVCAASWGIYEFVRTWEENPTKLKAPVKSAPVRLPPKIRTDGVLTADWVVQTLALPAGIALMELDLYVLRERLMASGQVKAAVLSRKFPDILDIVLEERTPVARIMAQEGEGKPEMFLVGRDGITFLGTGYGEDLLKRLPWLDGVILRKAGQHLSPINGMDTVAELLSTAYANIPLLCSRWQVVSLARFATDGEIVVRSKDVKELVFGTRDDFYNQIAKLDFLVDHTRSQPDPRPISAINLAVGGHQVPVTYEQPPPPAPASGPDPAKSAIKSSAQASLSPVRQPPRRPESLPNPQRTLHRDF